jgi:hypothetical protein
VLHNSSSDSSSSARGSILHQSCFLLLHLLLAYRLTNSIMMHGRNNGKKLMAVSSWLLWLLWGEQAVGPACAAAAAGSRSTGGSSNVSVAACAATAASGVPANKQAAADTRVSNGAHQRAAAAVTVWNGAAQGFVQHVR